MCCLRRSPLPMFLLLLLCGSTQCTTSCDSLTCVTDYLEHISCTWRVSVPPEPGMSYHLTAASPDEEISCNLAVTSCSDGAGDLTEYTCKLHEESGITMQNYTISIRTKSRGHETNIDTCPYFDTAQNIKLLAPFNLTVSHAAPCGMYNFTWQIAYDEMSYIEDFDYELRFKQTPDSWEPKKVKRLTNNQQLLQLVASELVSGTEHSAQVRTLPATGSGYTGTWSDWSPPITWSTARCDPDLDQIFQLPLLCALVSMLIVVVVIVTLNVPQRLWKKLWVMTPNPAPFFNPLFSDHGGNFTKQPRCYYSLFEGVLSEMVGPDRARTLTVQPDGTPRAPPAMAQRPEPRAPIATWCGRP